MIELIKEPWPWYVSGPLITLVMTLLLLMEKRFGMSSNLRTLCAICGAGDKVKFFDFDWKKQQWNLIVIAGVIIGGFIGSTILSNDVAVNLEESVVQDLNAMGFEDAGEAYMPEKLFDLSVFSNGYGLFLLVLGGFLVGFGTRYAGGCTSGHAISGLSNLQLPSLIAVIGFFIGGLLMIHVLFPLLF
jgi:hypothetical protein